MRVHTRHAAGCAVLVLGSPAAGGGVIPPENLTIAFIGDQGLGVDAEAVLQMIADEGADAVVHSGDFDYADDPQAWDRMITDILGPCFPYFAAAGNHDDDHPLYYGPGGYQEVLAARLDCLGIPWEGDLGVRSSHVWQGVLFVFTAPDLFGGVPGDTEFAPYIHDRLAASDAIWRISSWHVLMEQMQIGGKSDQSGWGVYEESRRGGAIVATGHEHSYGRTHPLSHCASQTVASFAGTFQIARDDPQTPEDEGVAFVFYNGLGGHRIRDQERCFPTTAPYGCRGEWASIYAEQQGANHGALFGVLHHEGNPRRAHFYFKDIDGYIADEFFVETTWGPCCPPDVDGSCAVDAADLLVLLEAWGTDPGGPPDVDGDGAVGILDFLATLAAWGPCGP